MPTSFTPARSSFNPASNIYTEDDEELDQLEDSSAASVTAQHEATKAEPQHAKRSSRKLAAISEQAEAPVVTMSESQAHANGAVDTPSKSSRRKDKDRHKQKRRSLQPDGSLDVSFTINFHIEGGPSFSRIANDVNGIESMREMICEKLGLPPTAKIHLAYLNEGAKMELDDPADFDVFERRLLQAEDIDVYVISKRAYKYRSAWVDSAPAQAKAQKRKQGAVDEPTGSHAEAPSADEASAATSEQPAKRKRRTKAEMEAFRAEQAAKTSSTPRKGSSPSKAHAESGTEGDGEYDSGDAEEEGDSPDAEGEDDAGEEDTTSELFKFHFCGICGQKPYHLSKSCPVVIKGKKAMQERLKELKELKQGKKGPERFAQKELKFLLKNARK